MVNIKFLFFYSTGFYSIFLNILITIKYIVWLGGNNMKQSIWKSYLFPIILISSIILGGVIGLIFGEKTSVIKPFGDLFLNLLFMIVVPLIFFSVSSAIASMNSSKRFGRIVFTMISVFFATGLIAATLTVMGVKVFPPAEGVSIEVTTPEGIEKEDFSIGEKIVQTVTVSEFSELFSRSNMLALIIFSILLGMATSMLGEKGKPFARFLKSGNDVLLKMVSIVMYYAPIGLGAYFASLVGEFGPTLLGSYFRAALFYYPLALFYFFIFFTLYAFIAGGKDGIKRFWKNMLSPTITSLATCSSAASIPVNLEATKKMGISDDVRETTVVLGATLHKDGSVIGAVLKITFAFGIFGIPFEGISTYITVILFSILVAMVIGAIPQGGMIGEMLILSLFALPIEALPILAAIAAIIDPPATMLNATGDNVASMLVDRFTKNETIISEKSKAKESLNEI